MSQMSAKSSSESAERGTIFPSVSSAAAASFLPSAVFSVTNVPLSLASMLSMRFSSIVLAGQLSMSSP